MRSPNRSWFIGTSRNFNGDQFYLADETGGQIRMGVQPGGGAITFPLGNVGIGTSSPNAKLSVVGSVTQDHNSRGLPKAMIFVLADRTIARCYNGTNGASTNGCGFSVGGAFSGDYVVSVHPERLDFARSGVGGATIFPTRRLNRHAKRPFLNDCAMGG
jgi:hypothetical protein